MAVRPYPYERWQRVSKHDADSIRSALRAVPGTEECARAGAEAEAVLGARLSIHPGAIELWSQPELGAALATPLCGLWLELAEGARALPLLCEMPVELGAALVDRVLGGDGTVAHPVGAALDDLSCGVLAYLGARVCAALGADLRVRNTIADAGTARALLGDGPVLVVPIALDVAGAQRGRLRMWIAQATARELAVPRLVRPVSAARVPPWLRALPITLCAHAGIAMLSQSDVRGLCVGDVIVFDRCSLVRGPAPARGFEGAIELRVLGSRGQFWHATARGAEIAIVSLERSAEAAMTEGKRIDTQAMHTAQLANDGEARPLAGDTPIELCLEIARFTLSLDELSALRPGEVLNARRAIGEQVSVTVGGRTLARGELVELDGEVGVRILELVR